MFENDFNHKGQRDSESKSGAVQLQTQRTMCKCWDVGQLSWKNVNRLDGWRVEISSWQEKKIKE